MTTEHVDVLIVGAGLSGIGAAYYLQTRCPAKRYAILEARDAIGGTWDLFRYPGVRSDSDMYTLGYTFRPWRGRQSDRRRAVDPASTSARRRRSTGLTGRSASATGYGGRRGPRRTRGGRSRPNAGPTGRSCASPATSSTCAAATTTTPRATRRTWPGVERFAGRIVHPQQWPDDLDYAGKRVVVIGSGATAVTLVPALAAAGRARHHAAALPHLRRGAAGAGSRRQLAAPPPARASWRIRLARWKNVLFGMYFYNLARRRPALTKQLLLRMVQQQLGPDYDVATHFTPRYNPWDQRLCLVPDADLFAAIKSGRASVVTDQIADLHRNGHPACAPARNSPPT